MTANTIYCLEFGVQPGTTDQFIKYYDDDYNLLSEATVDCSI